MEAVGITVGVAGLCALAVAGSVLNVVKSSDDLRVLRESPNASADIIFVHGTDDDRRKSWTGTTRSRKTDWTVDVLPTRLNDCVRILTYHSSSKISSRRPRGIWGNDTRTGRQDEIALRDLPQAVRIHSNRLLAQLTTLRGEKARDRPIIWVGQTVGGLIVKHALVQASAAVGEHSTQKAIHLATCGVLYFETPMQNTPQIPWSRILASMLAASLGEPLAMNAEKMDYKFDHFDLQSQRYKSIERHFKNFSFSRPKLKGKNRGFSNSVPEETLVLKNTSRQWISTKLRTRDLEISQLPSQDYELVIRAIQECLDNKSEAQHRSFIHYDKLACDLQSQLPHHHRHSPDSPPDKKTEIEIAETELSRVTSASSIAASIEEADSKLRDAERKNGYIHERTLSCIVVLAKTYESELSFLQAELLYKRALVALFDSESYGPWHRDTAQVLQLLSEVEIEQGKFLEATKNLLHLLECQKRYYGTEHLHTTRTMARIAVLYDKLHLWNDAEDFYRRVIEMRKKQGEDETKETLVVRENLALSYRLRGQSTLAKSARQYEAVYDIRLKHFKEFKTTLDPQTGEMPTKKALEGSVEYTSLTDITFRLAEVCESMRNRTRRRQLLQELGNCLKPPQAISESQTT